jgi:hypothetical protein
VKVLTLLSSGKAKKVPVLCTVEYCQRKVLVLGIFMALRGGACSGFRYVWRCTNVFLGSVINIVDGLYAGFKQKTNYNDIP